MTIHLSPDSALGKQLARWWLGLAEDSASRAELKRCSNATEVMLTPSFQRLCQQMPDSMRDNSTQLYRLAMITGLAAHLDQKDQITVLMSLAKPVESLAEQMAESVGGRPKVSELRFRRLIQRPANELYAPMIRILRMMKGKVNLYGLTQSIFYWGDGIKKRWAFAYFPKVPSKN